MNIVLDTNVLLQVACTEKTPRVVWDKLLAGEYILCVSEDSHFDELEKIDFPKVDVIGLKEFISILNR